MIAGVVDTHAALWYLLKNPRLSRTACVFMDDAASVGNTIALSAVSLQLCGSRTEVAPLLFNVAPSNPLAEHDATSTGIVFRALNRVCTL